MRPSYQPKQNAAPSRQGNVDRTIEAVVEHIGKAIKMFLGMFWQALCAAARDSLIFKSGYLAVLIVAVVASTHAHQTLAFSLLGAVIFVMFTRFVFTHRKRFQTQRQLKEFFGKTFSSTSLRLKIVWDQKMPGVISSFSVGIPMSFDSTQTVQVEQQLRHWVPPVEAWTCDWNFAGKVLTVRQTVALPDVVLWNETWAHDLPWWKFRVGVTHDHAVVEWNLLETPNGLFTGPPGTGKSTLINTLIATALERDWTIWAGDPKETEFFWLENVKSDRVHVAFGYQECWELTVRARQELAVRKRILKEHRARHMKDVMDEIGMKPMLVVIDEVFDLFSAHTESDEEKESKEACKNAIHSLSRLGRAIGVHVILAAQRPDAKVIEGEMRNNFRGRLLLGLPSVAEIQMMFIGAAPLETKAMRVGRGFWQQIDLPQPVNLQTPYASEQQLAEVVNRVNMRSNLV